MSKRPDGSATGRHAQLNPKRAKSLYRADTSRDLELAADPQRGADGADPYNLINEKTQITDAARRRSLDDMRRLSEAIKSTPKWTRPQKTTTSALYRRLSELRSDLEHALAEIQGIREGAAGAANPHLIELLGQLRDVTFHLEGAITSLRSAGGLASE
jgi:hypothetical protein